MKATLTGYFDLEGKLNLTESMQKAIKHGLDTIALRTYSGQPLLECSDGELKKIILDTKGERIKLSIIDSNITPYDPYDDRKHNNALDEFKYILKVADRLKVNHVLLRLPIIHNILEEFDSIEKRLGDYIDQAMRSGKKVVILPVMGYKANTYAYIFKKMKTKHMSIAFDPVMLMMSNESPTTAYRLLRSNISVFFAHDANHKGEPELLGFGKSDVLKVMKKLVRDRFDGYIMVDHQFSTSMFHDEVAKKGFFKKIFSNDKKQKEKRLRELSRRIFPDEETKNVTEDDILENQIKLVKAVFK